MYNKTDLKQQIRDLSSNGQYVEAIPPMERYCTLIAEEHGATSDRYVTVMNDLGGMYRNIGDFNNAEATFNKVLEIIRNKIGDKSNQYATATVNLACMYRFTKEFDKAEKLFLSAIEIYDADSDIQLLKNPNANHSALSETVAIEKSTLYANVCNNIGVMYQDKGDFEKAVFYHNLSIDMLRNTTNHEYLAISLNNFVNPFLHEGKFEDAKRVVNESLRILEEHLSKVHPFYSTALNNLGTIYFTQKDYRKALECFEETEKHLKNSFGIFSPQYQSCVRNIEVVKNIMEKESNANMLYVEEILALEWDMFTKTKNVGGKAYCQNNYPTFKIMRTSQSMSWNEEIRKSYLEDLTEAKSVGRNLLEEKYARMMFFTHNDEYKKLEHLLPPINEDFVTLALEIAVVYKNFDDEFSKNFPKLRGRGRQENVGTSADIYLIGELMTYSHKTLLLLRQYVKGLAKDNKNLVYLIQENTVKQYGYSSLEDAESKIN